MALEFQRIKGIMPLCLNCGYAHHDKKDYCEKPNTVKMVLNKLDVAVKALELIKKDSTDEDGDTSWEHYQAREALEKIGETK